MLKFHPLKAEELAALDWQNQPLAAELPSPDFAAKSLAEGNMLLTIFEEGKPIGMLELKQQPTDGKPRCAVVGTVVLLPAYRRHGLGRMLMAIAASTVAERGIWFLAGDVPDTPEARGFAAAIHMKQTQWYEDLWLLDLSDVEGLRYGNGK